MKVLVFGGSRFKGYRMVCDVLDTYHSIIPIDEILHGGAQGADSFGGLWAKHNSIPCTTIKARWYDLTATPCVKEWNERRRCWQNKMAGMNRNTLLVQARPDFAIGFLRKSGPGTADTASKLKKAGLPHFIVPHETNAEQACQYLKMRLR